MRRAARSGAPRCSCSRSARRTPTRTRTLLGQRALHLPGASRLAPLATCLQSGPFRAQERSACSLAVAAAACSSPGPSPRAARIAGARAQAERGELHEDRDARHIRRLGPQADTTKGGRRPRPPAPLRSWQTPDLPPALANTHRPASFVAGGEGPAARKILGRVAIERARETERSKATPDARARAAASPRSRCSRPPARPRWCCFDAPPTAILYVCARVCRARCSSVHFLTSSPRLTCATRLPGGAGHSPHTTDRPHTKLSTHDP